jgi:MFS family permease
MPIPRIVAIASMAVPRPQGKALVACPGTTYVAAMSELASREPARAPGATYAWYVVAVLTLANVSSNVDRQVLALLVMPIRRDLGLSLTQMSYLIGLPFAVFFSVMGLPLARLADRTSRRNVIAGGIGAWSIMTALCGLAGTFRRLLLTRIGVGVGEASLQAPATSLLADYFPPARLSSAMSVYSLGIFLGSGLGYFIGGWVVGLVGSTEMWTWPIVGALRPWQTVFFMVGLPGLAIAALMLTVREPVRRERAAVTPLAELVAWVRRHPRAFACHHLGFALSASVNYALVAWLATFLIQTYGWTAARAGQVQGILTMTIGVVGVLSGGRLADALFARGHTDAPLRVGIIGAVGMLVSATVYPLAPTATAAVAWLGIVNFFAALPWGAASAAAAELVPARMRAQGVAVFLFVLSLVSALLGPWSVAVVTDSIFHADAALRYSLAIVNVVGMTLAITLLALGLRAYRQTIAESAQST